MKAIMKAIWEDAKMAAGYEICCMGNKMPEKLVLVQSFLYICWSIVISSILGLICKRKGHKWVDESHGGPDHGCMAGTCKRCGYSFHTDLY